MEKLKQQQEADQSDKSDANVPWWERFVGIFENNPHFEEAVRDGQEWRASEDSFADENAV